MRRIVTRPSGDSCSRRNSAKSSLATMLDPYSILTRSLLDPYSILGPSPGSQYVFTQPRLEQSKNKVTTPTRKNIKRRSTRRAAAESCRFSTKPPAMNGALASLGLKHLQLTQIRHPRERASDGRAASTCWVRGLFDVPCRAPTKVCHPVTFLTTSPPLARALAERNYDSPTPVQTAVLAIAAAGCDLLVSAQTGSGKTVAYGLAIAKNLLGCAARFERAAAPLALIVAPTRELALQVQRELAWLYQYADARVVSCVGGMDPRREQRELAAGAHIVVGTPGRLCDHLRRGRLDVSELKAVVLDEADEMLDLGFRDDMEFILKTTPD